MIVNYAIPFFSFRLLKKKIGGGKISGKEEKKKKREKERKEENKGEMGRGNVIKMKKELRRSDPTRISAPEYEEK